MWRNQTEITEFILLGFGELYQLQIILFLIFLVIYIMTMAANIIAILIVNDWRLHTPMYFFLGNLSCLEIFYSSTILPRTLVSLLTGDKKISVSGYITQLYFFAFLISTECYLLSVMSFDRYIAVCKPLQYARIMNMRVCVQLVLASWMNSMIFTSIFLGMVLKIQFCGPWNWSLLLWFSPTCKTFLQSHQPCEKCHNNSFIYLYFSSFCFDTDILCIYYYYYPKNSNHYWETKDFCYLFFPSDCGLYFLWIINNCISNTQNWNH